MRFKLFRHLVLVTSLIGFASALSASEADPMTGLERYKLFLKLSSAETEAEARIIEGQIWQHWFNSGDRQINLLMQEAMSKRKTYDFQGALDVLNQVIAKAPEYPEAWNQRATVHFFMEKYEKSLEDVAKTLELEPKHFGAIAGRAVIRLHQAKPALARQNVIEALKIHPYLPEKKYFPDLK